jgi:ribulose 1,5-bisphosphate carboxylase large subunit-like protein
MRTDWVTTAHRQETTNIVAARIRANGAATTKEGIHLEALQELKRKLGVDDAEAGMLAKKMRPAVSDAVVREGTLPCERAADHHQNK